MAQAKLPQDVKDQVYQLTKDGMPIRVVAKKLGISYGAAHNHSFERKKTTSRYTKSERSEQMQQAQSLAKQGLGTLKISKNLGISEKYTRELLRTHHVEKTPSAITLPKPTIKHFAPFIPATFGEWLVLCDVHVPYHDEETLKHAIREAKERNVVGVVINGDFLDCHELSVHDKDPSAPRYTEEIKTGIQVLKWIRSELPNAEIVYKIGNHEERLDRYILNRAPALFDLEFATIESLLHFKDYDIQVVKNKRAIMLGKLHLLHGHEYRGAGGVNPARWIYLKARSVAMVGHFHRTSEHHARNIANRHEAAWSVGCACSLTPDYAPFNDWNNGYAFVHCDKNGDFNVANRRVFGGRVA